MRFVGRTLAVSGSFLFGVAVVLSLPTQVLSIQFAHDLTIFAIYFVAIGMLVSSYIVLHNHNKELDSDGTSELQTDLGLVATADWGFIDACMKTAFQRYTAEELDQVVSACVDLSTSVNRTVEHLDLQATRVHRRIAREVEAPAGPERRLILPIMRQIKGQLIDDLEVSTNGNSGHTLSYANNLGLSAVVLRMLFTYAFLDRQQPVFSRLDEEVFQRILLLCCAPTQNYFGTQRSVLRELRNKPGRNHLAKRALLELAEFLTSSYFIYQEVAVKESSFSTQIDMQVSNSTNRVNLISKKSNRFKLAIGVGIEHWLIELTHPFEAASYHLRSRSPDGTYLYRIALLSSGKTFEDDHGANRRDAGRNGPQQVRIARSRGTDSIHIYTSGLNSKSQPRLNQFLRLRLYFRAVPPGLLGPLVLLSGYLAAVTNIFSWQHDQIFAKPVSTVALILAVPGLLTSWLASRLTAKSLWISSYLFMLELGSLLFLSSCATVIAALKAAGPWTNELNLGSIVAPQFMIYHPVWFITTTLCTAHFCMCLADLLSRYWRYQKCLSDR